jgi:hypothetical protein
LFVVPSWFETRLAALLTMRRTGLSAVRRTGLSLPPPPEGERSERLEGWAARIVRIAGLPQAGLASAATPYMRNVEI